MEKRGLVPSPFFITSQLKSVPSSPAPDVGRRQEVETSFVLPSPPLVWEPGERDE